jgi:hypothetical protein
MPVQNELLDKTPTNCGNCKIMKTYGIIYKSKRRVVARCKNQVITRGQGWFIDLSHNKIPAAWRRAYTCPMFDNML